MHRRLIVATLAVLLAPALAPTGAGAAPPPEAFRNPRLPMPVRVDDLLRRLTLDEKVSLLHQYQPAIPRLGIGIFKTGTEALHGVAWSTNIHDNGNVVSAPATQYPQAIGLASTWDPALLDRIGAAVGDEARGLHATDPDVWGLNLWAPVVNPLRDPRWGRNEEGYSEDPWLTGQLATAYAGGMAGHDPLYLKTAPTLKHYLAYNNEAHRDTTSASVPPRVRHEYDETAFRIPLQAGAATGVMPSYNLVNGRPNTASPELDAIRAWGRYPLFNPSDAGGPGNLTGSQHYYATQAEADAAAIKAGLNSFTQDNTNAAPTVDAVHAALNQGLLTVADLDDTVRQNLWLRFRLGEFDPDGGPFGTVKPSTADNQRLARQAVAESAVLLKNSGVLPLRPGGKVAVVGPLADTVYSDWYGGTAPYTVTPRQGIAERSQVAFSEGVDRIALKQAGTGKYVVGDSGLLAATGATATAGAQYDVFDWGGGIVTLRNAANGKTVGYNWSGFAADQAQPNGWFVQQQFKLESRPDGNVVLKYAGYESAFDWAPSYRTPYVVVQADGTLNLGAATADTATEFGREVISSGADAAVAAATGADAAVVVVGSMPFINGREDHDRTDLDLAAGQEAIVRAVKAANPNTVVVVENSYPTALNWEQANAPALLWTSHAGQETGHGLADVLFGDRNPAGRLTQTWYRTADGLPSIMDYDIIGSKRTYQYYDGNPLYPLGYGLSYTTFRYGALALSQSTVDARGTVQVALNVTNTGARAGDEVVQLYTHQRQSRVPQPVKVLRGFQRVHLEAGQTKRVTFSVAASDLRFWDVTSNRWVVEDATHDILVGTSSADIRSSARLDVRGATIPARDLRSVRAADFDGYSGTVLVDEAKAGGTAVAATGAGQWLRYADADLRSSPGTFTARAASPGGPTTVQVRLDDPVRGQILATVNLPATADVYTYADITARVPRLGGRHDVYLVFGGPARLSTFSLR
ncbi:glycoside hydrolase family 3 C-terminal domain-containing protein [Dactylosporangium sp. NPDC051541]|uniref:glycoside hydrolase family 3 protein n=1 Tax=Dactylosporangium sp. NPDC051541 TaxID=3363977 RepID=UPI0037A7CAA1